MITKDMSKEAILGLASDCARCGKCCKFGSGFILPEEVAGIASYLNISEEKLKAKYLEEINILNKNIFKFKTKGIKSFGECIFLNRNLCKIEKIKPLNCRIANCNEYGEELNEWYISNNILDTEDPVSVREWASRLISKPTIEGANLHELIPNAKKLDKILRYKILR